MGRAHRLGQVADFVLRMWPPDFEDFGDVWRKLLETVQIALVGTVFGAAASFVLALLAARNITPRYVALPARAVLNFLRSIPELIYALIFVSALGLGNLPGVMALATAAVGTVGKIYADALESVRRQPIDALRAVGAGRAAIVTHGILPQALPIMVSYTLLLWDGAVRAATLLGIVGGGGIGLELNGALRTFRYDRALAILLCIMVIVTAIDQLSSWIRRHVQ
ncbi:MAG TPA: phosphonate ABC transporter, permease protein PhnE [Acidimicrobiales bacterium]